MNNSQILFNECFVLSPLHEVDGLYSKSYVPFPHVFGLRRLRTAIRLVRFGYNTFTGCVA